MSRPESETHPHRPEARAHLFTARGQGQTEDEYLGLLTAIVRCCKPLRALELGTYLGDGALAILRGMSDNGFGHLDTVEAHPGNLAKAEARLRAWAPRPATWCVHGGTGDAFLGDNPHQYQFAFLDCDLAGRLSALGALARTMPPGSFILIHDTSPFRLQNPGQAEPFRRAAAAVALETGLGRVDFPLSRGMTVFSVA